MKKSVFILFSLLIILSACNEDQVAPLSADGTVIASINHTNGNESWLETFEYDNQGRIVSIENEVSLGTRRTFHYGGDQLLEIRTIQMSDERLIFRDSMGYNTDGALTNVYKFSVNQGEDLPLSSIETFSYNGAGQVTEISTDNLWTDDYNPRKVFHWQNGNVVQEDHYWNGEDISIEFYMSYDDKRYVNTHGYIGFQYSEAITNNNVIEVDWTDHTGLYDTACKPCTTSYTYSNDLPTAFTTNWLYGGSITYKQIETVASGQ